MAEKLDLQQTKLELGRYIDSHGHQGNYHPFDVPVI